MMLDFPSQDFDEIVAAACHGAASEEQLRALNALLRSNARARDEYILRVELHSRLASDPDLLAPPERVDFAAVETNTLKFSRNDPLAPQPRGSRKAWALGLAAAMTLLAAGLWALTTLRRDDSSGLTSRAIAMLSGTADARWQPGAEIPRLGAPLEPGSLRLAAGLAQITFYSGARLVIEGPAELQIVSQNEAFIRRGRMMAEVPAQAHGFRVQTPHVGATELAASVAVEVKGERTELHVFKGALTLATDDGDVTLREGSGAQFAGASEPDPISANASVFAGLFDFHARSLAAEARRHDQWRRACQRLESDPSLIVHYDFENVPPTEWQLPNSSKQLQEAADATIVGCQWTEGRWPEKRALGFQSVSDRVRLTVPGEFQSLTVSAWVSVKGLDRKINSLFMSDGFAPGTIHWLIRRDGVLGLTVIGRNPGDHQIVASPPVITLDTFGLWLHLAAVLDSNSRRVVHYVNGVAVSDKPLRIAPPFRVDSAELGNWNPKDFPESDPFMIRNFSGAMDEFFLFNRALNETEIRSLYLQGKPQPEPVIAPSAN